MNTRGANWFVGLPVATWVGERLLTTLQASAPPGLRWFKPADLHLTLAFFGPVGEAAARRGFAAGGWHHGAVVRLGGLGAFGPRRHFSAIGVEPGEGRETLVDLIAAGRDGALRGAGARPDTRPPRPHLTIARPTRDATASQRAAVLDWLHGTPPPAESLTLDRVALYTWAADRRVRQFDLIDAHPLTLAGDPKSRT